MTAPINLKGKRFGRLLAIRDVGSNGKRRLWLCQCDCGGTAEVVATKLKSGHTRSCGCLLADKNRELRQTHGHAPQGERSLTYKSYTNMITRCENPRAINYERYGGAGINVCDRWRHGENGLSGFECFLADMGERPSRRHSIDRIHSTLDYEPNNCRWVVSRVQSLNRANTVMIDVNGYEVPLTVACELSGVPYGAAWYRLQHGQPWNGGAE
jgi:hypothetical protein